MKITDFHALECIAALFKAAPSPENQAFLGTCFAFRRKTHFLTAAHCIGDLKENEILLAHPGAGQTFKASSVVRHPTADIALIKVDSIESDQAQAFLSLKTKYGLGDDFKAFGFPEDVFGHDASQPVGRLFKGYFQRYFFREGNSRYRYDAGEMNIACPGGLSGGPVFMGDRTWVVFGLVTENLESTTFLHSVREIDMAGKVTREHYQNVINYGVCLMLTGVKDWLDEHIPKSAES